MSWPDEVRYSNHLQSHVVFSPLILSRTGGVGTVSFKFFNTQVSSVFIEELIFHVVVVVVLTPPLPRDGGMARTAIQVHAVNLIEIRLGKR